MSWMRPLGARWRIEADTIKPLSLRHNHRAIFRCFKFGAVLLVLAIVVDRLNLVPKSVARQVEDTVATQSIYGPRIGVPGFNLVPLWVVVLCLVGVGGACLWAMGRSIGGSIAQVFAMGAMLYGFLAFAPHRWLPGKWQWTVLATVLLIGWFVRRSRSLRRRGRSSELTASALSTSSPRTSSERNELKSSAHIQKGNPVKFQETQARSEVISR
jgi:hypothetical protein